MNIKKLACSAIAAAAFTAFMPVVHAEDTLFIPSLTYRTGPFAGGGIPFADGFADYFNMLNERDGAKPRRTKARWFTTRCQRVSRLR